MPYAVLRRALLPCLSVLTAMAVLAPAGHADTSAGVRLPDLDQEMPSQLDVSMSGRGAHRSYRLGFGSGVRNVGRGPLIIDAHRASPSAPMVGDQLIETDDGGPATVPGAGSMRYVRSPDHQHWHLLGFDRYELRRAGGARALVRDRKTGFCLGDRYRVTTRSVPQAAPDAIYRSRCGLTHPELLHVREGISVGYGDFYAAHIEYQDLPLDGLRDGRYVLVHRTNADRRLRESDYGNNAASVLLDVRWHDGVPSLKVMANCPDSARCERPDSSAPASPRAAAARVPLTRPVTVAERSMLCRLSWRA